MKIALVTYSLNVGGIETFIQLLADYCQAQGGIVTIIETLSEGRWSQSFRKRGYQVKQILPRIYQSRIRHAKEIAKNLSEYDLIVLNDAPFAHAGLGLLPDKTIVIPVLHSNMFSMLRNATANTINWDIISAVSPGLKDCAVKFGVDTNRIACVPNGINVPNEWPKKNAAFSTSAPFRIIFIGAINHFQKGVFYLPGIVKRVMDKNINVRMDIIGDGLDLPDLRQKFDDAGSLMCEFHGALSNDATMQLLKQADVLIMPSHFEGLGIVLIEAMSWGVVPIASRLEGITEFVITDGVDGSLIQVGNKQGFAEAILSLSRARDNLRSMSQAAWKTAASRFSYQVMGKTYLSLAEDLHRYRIEARAKRNGVLDISLLGDFPYLPIALVRPVRKVLRMLGLYKDVAPAPLLYDPQTPRHVS